MTLPISLNDLGPYIYREIHVKKLDAPKILWLNYRWLLANEIDIYNEDVHSEICTWIIENYAVTVSSDKNVASILTMGADRYGGSFGNLHGGSGRCAASGQFNAKGIGKTPLVAENVDWSHSHGQLFLSDAIREAICSELVSAEMPHGSVPVIAIIDTGNSIKCRDSGILQRCAIIVRPNFIRPAHFQRSIFFGTAGYDESDQFIDAKRVRDAIHSFNLYLNKTCETVTALTFIDTLLAGAAEQLATSRALRMWHGRFCSDNIIVGGAFVDFGSFRSIPDWRAADDGRGQIFGREYKDISAVVGSLYFYWEKFSLQCAPNKFDKMKYVGAFVNKINSLFITLCASNLGVDHQDSTSDRIAYLIQEYYNYQQSITYAVDQNVPPYIDDGWLDKYFNIEGGGPEFKNKTAHLMASEIRDLLLRHWQRSGVFRVRLSAARRWLEPRTQLYYKNAKINTNNFLMAADVLDNRFCKKLSLYISMSIAANRRHWPDIPQHLIIIGFATDGASSAVYGFDPARNKSIIRLYGHIINGCYVVFKQRVKLDEYISSPSRKVGAQVVLECEIEKITHDYNVVAIGETRLTIPPPNVFYRS